MVAAQESVLEESFRSDQMVATWRTMVRPCSFVHVSVTVAPVDSATRRDAWLSASVMMWASPAPV